MMELPLNPAINPASTNYSNIHQGTGDLMLALFPLLVSTYFVTAVTGHIVALWQHKGNAYDLLLNGHRVHYLNDTR
jgi:hypothetical protein